MYHVTQNNLPFKKVLKDVFQNLFQEMFIILAVPLVWPPVKF
jgi:hypothetical protein